MWALGACCGFLWCFYFYHIESVLQGICAVPSAIFITLYIIVRPSIFVIYLSECCYVFVWSWRLFRSVMVFSCYRCRDLFRCSDCCYYRSFLSLFLRRLYFRSNIFHFFYCWELALHWCLFLPCTIIWS